MATTPQWVVLQNNMRIEFVHTHLHTTLSIFSIYANLLLKWLFIGLALGGVTNQNVTGTKTSLKRHIYIQKQYVS